MAIDVTVPHLGSKKMTARDLVISTLMYEHPLNLAKITNSIKKKHSAPVTFQGVRKAVTQLVDQGVLEKNDKQYAISKDWIMSLRNVVEQLQNSYFSESSGVTNVESLGDDIKIYTFDNLIDLDKFWNVVVGKWFEDDSADKSKKNYLQLSGHVWYVLGQLQEETAIVEKMRAHNIDFYIVAPQDTFLDNWCKIYYEKLGCKFAIAKEKENPARYFSIYKDLIIQTTYPDDLVADIEKIYQQTKSFETFDNAALIKILRGKTEVKVTVMRNPLVTEQLGKFILSHFTQS